MISKTLLFKTLIAIISICYIQAKPINGRPKTVYQKNSTRNFSLEDNNERPHRQVVQPKWLTQKEETKPVVDKEVRVTNESLREVDAIRKAIQKAVDEDTYAVEATKLKDLEQLFPESTRRTTPTDLYKNECFEHQSTDRNSFMHEFHKLWLEMMEKFRRMMNIWNF